MKLESKDCINNYEFLLDIFFISNKDYVFGPLLKSFNLSGSQNKLILISSSICVVLLYLGNLYVCIVIFCLFIITYY